MIQTQRDRVVLDASAWIAFDQGAIDELDTIIEDAELLTSPWAVTEILTTYAGQGKDPMPLIRLLEEQSDIVNLKGVSSQRLRAFGQTWDADELHRAASEVAGVPLISVVDNRVVRWNPVADE